MILNTQYSILDTQYSLPKLSVNINKIALLRNSRGGDVPNVVEVAKDCERFGADGITVHPRPDERHIKYADVYELKDIVKGEFNIEGNPTDKFLQMVTEVKPHQCTLVPDAPDALTSNEGWDTLKHRQFLQEVIRVLKQSGIRVSLFIDPIEQFLEGAAAVEADRVEFYTGPYAHNFPSNPEKAIIKYKNAAEFCKRLGLGINAGHDLNLDNLGYFSRNITGLLEVSIGHALISDALYLGLENTVQMYQLKLHRDQHQETSSLSA